MQQVRAAYEKLKDGGKGEDAIQYLSRVVETKEAERSDRASRHLERIVGVEFVARACLAAEYGSQGRNYEALQALDHCEGLLISNIEVVSPGFLAKDWLELGRLSFDLGFPFAALRRVDFGLKADRENEEVRELQRKIDRKSVV